MSEYTPTTEEVRGDYANVQLPAQGGDFRVEYAEGVAEFDRWLAGVRAEAWDVGAKAMMSAIGDEQTVSFIAPHNPHREGAPASVVTEEPEWEVEYGVRGDVDSPMSSREAAEHAIERMAKAPRGYRITRTLVERKVTRWLPAQQEGTEQ